MLCQKSVEVAAVPVMCRMDITERKDIHWSSVSSERDIFLSQASWSSEVHVHCTVSVCGSRRGSTCSAHSLPVSVVTDLISTTQGAVKQGMCACETHMESVPTRLLLTRLQLHIEASSVSRCLISLPQGRKYHEWLMHRGVSSSLPGLFSSTEHTLVVCFVFSVSLCSGGLRKQIFPSRENLPC